MKKLIITMLVLFLSAAPAFGVASNRRYYHIEALDEWGELLTTVTQVDVQNESGVAVAVYSTKSGSTEVGSTGVITTGLSDGMTEFWYADTAIDLTVTDGTYNREIESFGLRDHRFMLPTFLTAMSGSNYGVDDNIDFTYASWIIDGDTLNRLDMIPDNDGAVMGIGDGTAQADVYIYSTSAKYTLFDEGAANVQLVDIDLFLDDDAKLFFGDSTDVTIEYDESNDDLDILSTSALDLITFGATADSYDLQWFGGTAGSNLLCDEGENELYLTGIDIMFDDNSDLIFGSDEDFTVYSDTANILEFDPATQGNTIYFGTVADDSVDMKWFTTTSGNFVTFDEGADEVYFTDVDVQIDDDCFIIFGDGDDWTISSTSATILQLTPAGSAELDQVIIGATTAGADLKVWGTTGTDYILWDATEDQQIIIGDEVTWTLTEAASTAVNIDITGTAGGFDLDTTDGAVALTAGGATNGDITLTAADDFTLAVTGSTTVGDILFLRDVEETLYDDTILAAESGRVFANYAGVGALVYTLPAAATGLTCIFIDCSATAGDDVTITAGTGDTINGGGAAGTAVNDSDEASASITLVAIDEVRWVSIAASGTWRISQ